MWKEEEMRVDTGTLGTSFNALEENLTALHTKLAFNAIKTFYIRLLFVSTTTLFTLLLVVMNCNMNIII